MNKSKKEQAGKQNVWKIMKQADREMERLAREADLIKQEEEKKK